MSLCHRTSTIFKTGFKIKFLNWVYAASNKSMFYFIINKEEEVGY